MKNKMSDVSLNSLLLLIKSCDFLEQELVLTWEENVKKLPKSFYVLIYRTFKECKTKYESLYVKFGLQDDSNAMYKDLVKEKCSQAFKIVSQSHFGALGDIGV